jgi:integrase
MVNNLQYNEQVHDRSDYSTESNGKSKTAEQWRVIWLNKFDRVVKKEGTDKNRCVQMREVISSYLLNNPGAPYYIKEHSFNEYLAKADHFQFETIKFLYDTVALSSKHQELIKQQVQNSKKQLHNTSSSFVGHKLPTGDDCKEKGISEHPCKQPFIENSIIYETKSEIKQGFKISDNERAQLLEKLKLEIKARNLADSTLRHYNGAVSRFMDWLTPESARDWSTAFKEHLVWLREERKLAANTINQYAASIAFFMEEVLDLEPGGDILIRMKTGKPLPRVHSLEKIMEIINAPSNFKHRLILMITYGCGLRLGEVCVLRPNDIDLDRKTVTIRKAKGMRDRVVMLDDELAPYVSSWLKNGCGPEFLFEGYTREKHLSKRTVEKIYTNACKKQNIDSKGGIHSLRHYV